MYENVYGDQNDLLLILNKHCELLPQHYFCLKINKANFCHQQKPLH